MKHVCYDRVTQRAMAIFVVLMLTMAPSSAGLVVHASRALPETSGQIAFVSNRDGNYEIYLMNMDETGLTRLTTNTAGDEGPTWSPDGTRIAFQSNRLGYNQIFTMNADGGNQTRLIASGVIDEWPYWSPTGNKIAFARVADHNGDGLRSEVFVANSDGTGARRLTYSSGKTGSYNHGAWPSGWSPDGSQIVFYWYREGYDQLWIMNSDGTNQRKLTTDSYWNAMPSMAPDGRKVAFASYRDGNYEIYTVNSDGTNATRLTNQAAEEWRPIWSQDGSKIIFESRRTGKTQIYSMSVDGSQQTRLTSSNSYDGQQAWRPTHGSGNSGLTYAGPLSLPSNNWMLDEMDGRITAGDHVHLFLPFKNTGTQPLVDAKVRISGTPQVGRDFGISIWNGTSWLNWQQTVSITPSTLQPGQVGVADFWIYVTDNDPDIRSTLGAKAWLRIESGSSQWTVQMRLDPIGFSFDENSSMKAGSCLHNPTNFEIQRYAQYAAAAWTMTTPPTNAGDPDTPAQAVKNLVKRVKAEFNYNDIWAERQSDTTLLAQRNGDIGVCRDYADLTVGLLRSLGLPTRFTDSIFRSGSWWQDGYKYSGHAWAEVYLGGLGWRQADSTWSTALNEPVYEARGYQVMEAWADRFPLSSATIKKEREYQCVASCYTPPVFCTTCKQDSLVKPPSPELSCVEDVTSRYHQAVAIARSATIENPLDISISAPSAVTRTVPFMLETLIANRGSLPLSIITATVAISEYIDSRAPLFGVAPPYITLSQLAPGEGVTLTWTITPLTTGSSIPLLVTAETADSYTLKEQPVSVNEPGTLPDLTILEGCDSATVKSGQPVTLTASLLDQYRQPLTDAASVVTASLRSAADTGFLLTTQLPYCVECGYYRQFVSLPADAPLGRYDVELHASRPGYDSDESRSSFFVAPVLDIMVEVAPQSVLASMPFTITAHITQRGVPVEEGLVVSRIVTPGGEVTLPLNFSAGVYSVTLSPDELWPDLGGSMLLGNWTIQVTTEYLGSSGVGSTSLNVRRATYLPLLLRGS